ncbi:MAG: HAMP domain-containing histidine kinase, partial [Oscillospiraceae bacterium]|nr:HAMP domain-containing histidine kinase [Oscillospiraceae bacterium]
MALVTVGCAVDLCAGVFIFFLLDGPPALAALSLGIAGAGLHIAAYAAFERRSKQDRQAHEETARQLAAAREKAAGELHAAYEQKLESFRSTVSHTLRMPVAIIQGYAELLCGDMVQDPAVRREYLEKIIQRSQYMTDVMSRSLFAEGAIDKSKLSYSEFDLLQMLRQAQADTRAAASEREVSVEVISGEESITLCADAYLLNRAVFNLLENALKYMGRPGTVTMRAVRGDERVTVTVSDDGMGLPEEEAAHIFERRFRGSTHAGMSGQGYGLHIVKQTVEAHGGSVRTR